MKLVVEASASGGSGPGDPIKLVLTLRNAETSLYQWSDRYSIAPESWFGSQDAAVRNLVAKLKGEVSAGRIARLSSRQHYDGLAYDRWLRGQASIMSYEPSAWTEADASFRNLIAEFPDFAPAYSSLAQMGNGMHFVHPGLMRNPERTKEAQAMARRAAGLDPLDSRSHLCLGWAFAMAGRHKLAEEHHNLAVELNESDPWTLTSAALGYAFRGQKDRAMMLSDQSLKTSPNQTPTHWGYHAPLRFLCGHHEDCIEAAEAAGEVIVSTRAWRAAALIMLGRASDAEAEYVRFIEAARRRWVGDDQPTPARIAAWLLHSFPLKLKEDWIAFAAALERAGADVRGLMHGTIHDSPQSGRPLLVR
jgi:tetratricopeptide (TPR) repeat protein